MCLVNDMVDNQLLKCIKPVHTIIYAITKMAGHILSGFVVLYLIMIFCFYLKLYCLTCYFKSEVKIKKRASIIYLFILHLDMNTNYICFNIGAIL